MQKIQSAGSKLMEPVLHNRLKEIQIYFLENRDTIIMNFKKSVEMICSEADCLQRIGKKEPIQFFSISYLQRCIFTKKYEVRLDLYNKDFYLDKCRIVQYWDMNFLFQFFEKDMIHFKKNIGAEIFQLKDYEEKEFALWYITHYYKIAELFFRVHITDIINNKFFQAIEKNENFKVVFGGYMDEQIIIHQKEGNGGA